MNESNVKRRIWIRNILIIFLTVLLLLTFFSQTILNYSLPIVSVRYPSWGTIASRVNVTGSVRANRSYDVTIDQTRQIEDVLVRVGQSVQKGDILFTLVDGGSEELAQAEKLLSELKIQLIQKQKDDPTGLPSDTADRILQLTEELDTAKNTLSDEKDALSSLEKQYAAISGEQGKLPTLLEVQAAKVAVEMEKNNVEMFEEELERLRGKRGQTGGDSYLTDDELTALLVEKKRALDAAELAATEALNAKNTAEWMHGRNQALLKAAEEELKSANAKLAEQQALMPQGSVTAESLAAEYNAIEALKAKLAAAEPILDRLEDAYGAYMVEDTAYTKYVTAEAAYNTELAKQKKVADDLAQAISAFSAAEYDRTKAEYEAAKADYEAAPTEENMRKRDDAFAAYRPHEAQYEKVDALRKEYEDLLRKTERLYGELTAATADYNKDRHSAAKAAYDAAVLAADGKTLDALRGEVGRLAGEITQAEQTYAEHQALYEANANANQVLQGLKTKADNAKKQVDMLTVYVKSSEEALAEANAAITKAESVLATAKSEHERAQSYHTYEELTDEIKKTTALKEEAEARLAKAEATIAAGSAENGEALDEQLKTKQREIDAAKKRITAAERSVANIEKQIADAKKNADVDEMAAKLQKEQYEIELSQLKAQVEKQQKEVERLRKMSTDGTVVAPAAGVVEALPYSIGMTAPANTPIATITLAEAGYTMECTVSAREAAQIRVGDVGEILYYYWGEVPTAKVVNIQSAQGSMGQSRTVTLEITGQVEAGVNLTVALGSKNQSYDAVVPSSAIREDQNGKFVLIVTSKNTPLGNRYTAKRVDVEVLASDTVNSAISGDVSGQYVITHAEVPISSGDAVRLSEE